MALHAVSFLSTKALTVIERDIHHGALDALPYRNKGQVILLESTDLLAGPCCALLLLLLVFNM